MIEVTSLTPSRSATFVAVSLSAAMAAGHSVWPQVEGASYVATHVDPTYGFFQRSFPIGSALNSDGEEFAGQIASVYANLVAGQEPLGPEFEVAWDQSIDKLYEA